MDLNRDPMENTLLHLAVEDGDEKKVDEILDSDTPAMVNAVNRDRQTPLHCAKGTFILEKLLSYRKKLFGHDEPSRLPECFHNINANAGSWSGLTRLHIASVHNDHEVAAVLLKSNDVDVNARDNELKTPLHTAAMKNAHEVAALLLERSDVDVNAQANAPAKLGQTPLHYASRANAHEVAALLLKSSDVDVNALNWSHKTALDFAVERGATECAELLRGASAGGTSE